MRLGELRQRVEIQTLSETPDIGTSLTPVYTKVAIVWAKVEDVKGITKFSTFQIDPAITHRITIRYRSGVTTENWILYDGRRFRIRSVADRFERGRFLFLDCEEAFDSGT